MKKLRLVGLFTNKPKALPVSSEHRTTCTRTLVPFRIFAPGTGFRVPLLQRASRILTNIRVFDWAECQNFAMTLTFHIAKLNQSYGQKTVAVGHAGLNFANESH